MLELIDNKYTQGALGAILGALATIFVFKNRIKQLEEEHLEFRKETQIMFREIREDIKILLGRRRDDRDFVSKMMRDDDN
jgi:hypothetical protein